MTTTTTTSQRTARRQLLDDVGGEEDTGHAANREAERGAEVIAPPRMKRRLPTGHQERTRSPIMIETPPSDSCRQADEDHARRIQPDPQRHQRSEHEVADDADRERDRRARRMCCRRGNK